MDAEMPRAAWLKCLKEMPQVPKRIRHCAVPQRWDPFQPNMIRLNLWDNAGKFVRSVMRRTNVLTGATRLGRQNVRIGSIHDHSVPRPVLSGVVL